MTMKLLKLQRKSVRENIKIKILKVSFLIYWFMDNFSLLHRNELPWDVLSNLSLNGKPFCTSLDLPKFVTDGNLVITKWNWCKLLQLVFFIERNILFMNCSNMYTQAFFVHKDCHISLTWKDGIADRTHKGFCPSILMHWWNVLFHFNLSNRPVITSFTFE